MKHLIALATTVVFVSAASSRAQTAVDRLKDAASDIKHAFKDAAGAVAQKTRHVWRETKEYGSTEPESYRRAAATELSDLGATISDLKRDPGASVYPAYFTARLDALAAQQTSCVQKLAALTPEDMQDRQSVRRADFDSGLSWLETYVDLADREAREMPIVRR